MRGPHTGEALRLGLDHGAEVVAAESALLLEAGAVGGKVAVGQGFMHEAVAGVGAIRCGGGKGGVCRLRREQRVFSLAAVGGAT